MENPACVFSFDRGFDVYNTHTPCISSVAIKMYCEVLLYINVKTQLLRVILSKGYFKISVGL